jgi:hypothetical protein
MAMVVVVLQASDGQPALQPAAVSELAELGITNLAVVRDESLVGLVLEGWAFDPGRAAEAVGAVVADPGTSVRTLQPLLQMGVSTAPWKGGEV